MKFLSRLLLLSLFGWGPVFAQSNLPGCQGSDVSRWTNCVGTSTFDRMHKYVGEWKNGKPNGQGIFTFVVGSRYVGELRMANAMGLVLCSHLMEQLLIRVSGPTTILSVQHQYNKKA